MSTWSTLAEHVLAGHVVTRDEAHSILHASADELLSLPAGLKQPHVSVARTSTETRGLRIAAEPNQASATGHL